MKMIKSKRNGKKIIILKKYNYKIITPIVICNYHNHPIKTMTTASTIKTGKIIYTYK